MKIIVSLFLLLFISFQVEAQYETDNHSEIGIEIQAASISTRGGTVGGALKYAYVMSDQIVVGPIFRMQYNWSKDLYYGDKDKLFTFGFGGFFHVRFLEWFYVGTDIEYLKNPFNNTVPSKKWSFVGLIGGGIAKDFGPVVLSAGLMYDLIDGLNNPYTTNSSPLSRGYFLKVTNPKKPNYGRYIPLLYRITLFIPLGRDNQ